ncbi:chloride channel protein [Azorhizobium oxalatiphilum]|uniref:Chloride channel protein n=1 Tax=Azorhizobium oxalatiphilum TaxID=980631 RepID=A0A917CDQ8_9HYPH|nr:chloride channel protein [Azorhizobium oxalatiphilum]GGF82760.1 chloride channel protein [Azorhizobium oxalatiphilum]
MFRRDLRRIRFAFTSKMLWKRRMVFLLGAVAVGVASVVFAKVADGAQDFYVHTMAHTPWVFLILTPLGFGLFAWATTRWFDGAQGSGIPQAIAARRSGNPVHRARLLSAKVTIGKIALTCLGLAVGGSIGREGPTVQLGCAIMVAMAAFAGLGRANGLVLVGAAAGIAGAFNTPLAGVMFAIEEMAKSYDKRLTGLISAAVVISGMVSLALVGQYSYFGSIPSEAFASIGWGAVIFCAVVGGVGGAIFSRGLVAMSRARGRYLGPLKKRPFVFGAVCGLIIAVLAIATDGFAGGSGYGPTRDLLEQGVATPWWYAPIKLLTTLLSSASGIPGGLFSPSLSVGANIGAALAPFMPEMDIRALAMLGMVGYFAGVVQAPLTAFIIVMEMTNEVHLVVPLLATALLGAGVSRLLAPEPLYHALSFGYDPTPDDKAQAEALKTESTKPEENEPEDTKAAPPRV